MEAKVIFMGCLMLLFFSCNNRIESNNRMPLNQIQNQWYIGLKDTVLIENFDKDFVKYNLQGDTIYNVEWGNETTNNKSITKFDVLGSGVLGLLDRDENTIILSQGCGTACVYYVILPLKQNALEKVYYFAMAYDLKNNLIAYVPEDDGVFIRVENFITGETMNVREDNLCSASFKRDCIDTIYFKKGSLAIKWQGGKWEQGKPDLQEKIIPVNF